MLKKSKSLFHIFVICLLILILGQITVLASDGNVDHGGSGGGSTGGTGNNFYTGGDFGLRLTVIDVSKNMRASGTRTVDYYKIKKEDSITIYHGGGINKLEYIKGASLSFKNKDYTNYSYYKPDLCNIIDSTRFGKATKAKIQAWFGDSNLQVIASNVGMSFDTMKNGNYKLLLEPIIYITYQGKYHALTAHEGALLNEASGGKLRSYFASYTHKNVPLALFLTRKDFGISAWTGSKVLAVSDANIKKYLGVGIYGWEKQVVVEAEDTNYTYRVGTEVISAIDVTASGEANGDNPISVEFDIPNNGTKVVNDIVIPSGGTQRVWVRWNTPDTPQTVNIGVRISGGAAAGQATITCKIKKITPREPLNPKADDEKTKGFDPNKQPVFPISKEIGGYSVPKTQRSWTKYTCTKRAEIIGYTPGKNPQPIIRYYWQFYQNNYTASITSSNLKITPDPTSPTANFATNTTKSGYGVVANWESRVTGARSDVTGFQTAIFYFPEFSYKGYKRIGRRVGETVVFPKNPYSILKNRVHFTPLWYPDGNYQVYGEMFDCWTPVGQLVTSDTGNVNIKGTVYEDYYISVIRD